jgi:inosine-uridine nucleoside N-ribohydrolase
MVVAVAFHPEIVKQFINKAVDIETEGKIAKGMMVVDWLHRDEDEKHKKAKIVCNIHLEEFTELMADCIRE